MAAHTRTKLIMDKTTRDFAPDKPEVWTADRVQIALGLPAV